MLYAEIGLELDYLLNRGSEVISGLHTNIDTLVTRFEAQHPSIETAVKIRTEISKRISGFRQKIPAL